MSILGFIIVILWIFTKVKGKEGKKMSKIWADARNCATCKALRTEDMDSAPYLINWETSTFGHTHDFRDDLFNLWTFHFRVNKFLKNSTNSSKVREYVFYVKENGENEGDEIWKGHFRQNALHMPQVTHHTVEWHLRSPKKIRHARIIAFDEYGNILGNSRTKVFKGYSEGDPSEYITLLYLALTVCVALIAIILFFFICKFSTFWMAAGNDEKMTERKGKGKRKRKKKKKKQEFEENEKPEPLEIPTVSFEMETKENTNYRPRTF